VLVQHVLDSEIAFRSAMASSKGNSDIRLTNSNIHRDGDTSKVAVLHKVLGRRSQKLQLDA
jgi:hypothetical protein